MGFLDVPEWEKAKPVPKRTKRKEKKQAPKKDNPLVVQEPKAEPLLAPLTEVEILPPTKPVSEPKPTRHWFWYASNWSLGLIAFGLSFFLAGIGAWVNYRYNASFGKTDEWSQVLAIAGFTADACALFLYAVGTVSRSPLIFAIWIIAAIFTVSTTAGFISENVGDKVAAREAPGGQTTKTVNRTKFRTITTTTQSKPPATGAADATAHFVSQWLPDWFHLKDQTVEQTIRNILTGILALLLVGAGPIFNAGVSCFRRQA